MSDFIPPGVTDHLFNAGCARCSAAVDLIDLDVHIIYEGAIALCKACVGDLAGKAGFALTADYADRLAAAEAARDRALEQASEAGDVVRRLKAAYDRVPVVAKAAVTK